MNAEKPRVGIKCADYRTVDASPKEPTHDALADLQPQRLHRRKRLPSVYRDHRHLGTFLRPNDGDQRLANLDFPSRPILSRVRCIAWMLIMASCVEATESYKPVTSSRLGVICAEA